MKKRSILSLLIACVLMMAFATPLLVSASSMERSVCSHPDCESRTRFEYAMDSETCHQRSSIFDKYCTVCNALLSVLSMPYRSEEHSLSFCEEKSYHMGTTHVWAYQCPCGYTIFTEVSCYGSPCSSRPLEGILFPEDFEPCKHTETRKEKYQEDNCFVTDIYCAQCDTLVEKAEYYPSH